MTVEMFGLIRLRFKGIKASIGLGHTYINTYIYVISCSLFMLFLIICYGVSIISMMNALSEGLVLASTSGLDPWNLLDVLVRKRPRTFLLTYFGILFDC